MRCQAESGDPSVPVHDHWEDHNLSGKECVQHKISIYQSALILKTPFQPIESSRTSSENMNSACLRIQSGERMNKYWVK